MNMPPGMEGQAGGNDNNQKKAEEARQKQENQENAKNSILSQILDQAAIVRLSNLAAAKPDKAKMVEATIINMAKRGQLAGKMTDEGLKALLEKVSVQTQRTTTVKFDRRRAALDSDDDDY